MLATKRQYRPNLVTLMNLSQSNYMLLLRLLADKELVGEQRQFSINSLLSYTLTVIEVTRYTSLVTIAQDEKKGALKQLLSPKMEIRLYHDARMVDVLSCQHLRQIKAKYDYPNADMHQPDEKQQIQEFLKEWLQLCLQQGQAKITCFQSYKVK